MAASDTIIDGSFPGVERRYGVVVFSGGYPLAGLMFLMMFLLLITLTVILPQTRPGLARCVIPSVICRTCQEDPGRAWSLNTCR